MRVHWSVKWPASKRSARASRAVISSNILVAAAAGWRFDRPVVAAHVLALALSIAGVGMAYLLSAIWGKTMFGLTLSGARQVLYAHQSAAGLGDQRVAGEKMGLGGSTCTFSRP